MLTRIVSQKETVHLLFSSPMVLILEERQYKHSNLSTFKNNKWFISIPTSMSSNFLGITINCSI